MAFKIVSEKDYLENGAEANGQILRTGEQKEYNATIAADEEAKLWADGKVKITVLDEDTLRVSWGARKISLHMSVAGSSAESSGIVEMIRMKWSEEKEVLFNTVGEINLNEPYHNGPILKDKILIHF